MRITRLLVVAIVVGLVAAACSEGTDGPPTAPERTNTTTTAVAPAALPPLRGLELQTIADTFEHPVAIVPAQGIDDTFVVERPGRLTALSDGNSVLDITAQTGWEISEQGFLGFAVHPSFPDDPRGFAVYTDLDEDVVLAAFEWNGSRFDLSTETELLTVPQPHFYHQGGGLVFGPRGYLWASFGDGGGNGDPYGNGQNPDTLNGTVIRIDVDAAKPYAVPETNPFVEGGGAPEVWAFGMRNPWRVTPVGDLVIVADVGFEVEDEIDMLAVDDAGANLGWPIMEGSGCYDTEDCATEGLTVPTVVIPHERSCAVIGGPVYRGELIPELWGHYVFGDHCVGWVRSIDVSAGPSSEVVDWEPMLGTVGNITTFGVDESGELMVATLDGLVARVVAVR